MTAREDRWPVFRTDIERLSAAHRHWAPLDVLMSTNTQAVFRGRRP